MVSIVAAVADNGAIGKDNSLLWHISEDMKFFRELTVGRTVIMGRKTYESIGRPLPRRRNIVISRQMQPVPGIEVFPSIEEAVKAAADEKCFIIGGGEVGVETAERLLINHYYLYLQKNMAGNQENVGYCIPGRANLYNILMMEEKHTVVGIGAGSSTKVVIKNADPSLFSGNESRVERHENVKNIEIYLNSSKRPDGDLS